MTVGGHAVDIAIVGGGVAGCAAALTLARSGRSVALVAASMDRGERIGEFLSPAGNALLRELGLAREFAASAQRPANAVFSCWGGELLAERNAIVHLDGPGHVLDRRDFERMLAGAAARSGAIVLNDTVVVAECRNDTWSIGLSVGGRLAARFVLDCSGRAAIVARGMVRRRRVDRLVAAHAFLRQRDDSVEPTPATLIEAVPEGWWYASLLPDRRLALALFGDPDTIPRHVSRDVAHWRDRAASTRYIQRWLDSAGYAIETPPVLASAGTTWLEPAAGLHWAAAGDAAAAFDPLSSHGLTSALWGGRRAAHAALADLAGDPLPLEHYSTTIQSAVREFVLQRRAMYARETRWRDQPFWQRRG